MDHVTPLYEFRDRIFYVHFKDVKLPPDRLCEVGTMAYLLEYMVPRLPGFGDADRRKYVPALTDIGYSGHVYIEVEDKAFEDGRERILSSLKISK